MLEKMTRMLMRHGNRSAAQKTLLKTLFKLRELAEKEIDGTSLLEKSRRSILQDTTITKITKLEPS